MDPRLQEFIAHARGKGMDHATIRLLLLSAGWKEREIVGAMATEGLDLPVPEPHGGGGARDAFLYLLCFGALYAVLGAVLVIAYQCIDYFLPDFTDRGYYYSGYYYDSAKSTVRMAISAIIISFPLFAGLARLLRKEIRRDPERQNSPVRRWLTYLTLLIAAGVMTGDLISVLFYFLQGELSTQFVAKVIVLFVVAASVFSYYAFSLRPLVEQDKAPRTRAAVLALGLVLICSSIAGGFYLVGDPGTARLRRIDEFRLQALREIQRTVQEMTSRTIEGKTTKHPLPANMAEIMAYSKGRQYHRELVTVDPAGGGPFEYRKLNEDRYELCASFDLVRDEKYDLFWNHGAGRHCFVIDRKSPP
jgi:hypothetical protein